MLGVLGHTRPAAHQLHARHARGRGGVAFVPGGDDVRPDVLLQSARGGAHRAGRREVGQRRLRFRGNRLRGVAGVVHNAWTAHAAGRVVLALPVLRRAHRRHVDALGAARPRGRARGRQDVQDHARGAHRRRGRRVGGEIYYSTIGNRLYSKKKSRTVDYWKQVRYVHGDASSRLYRLLCFLADPPPPFAGSSAPPSPLGPLAFPASSSLFAQQSPHRTYSNDLGR
mmetsp:Transcript_3461/g.13930  ORF Transcript_3461/g.13930 Transcript_3461/m.13930 type:complete len:226 (-) Transcript_3461:4728-5405(-)